MPKTQLISHYLNVVPLPLLFLAGLLGIAGFLMIPGRVRLYASLIFMVLWLELGKYPDLGFLQAMAKATSVVAYAAVAVAALIHPGPRRRLSPITWLYVAMAVLSCVYVLPVREGLLGIVLQVQWVVLTAAALLLVRVCAEGTTFRRVLITLTVAMGIAMLIPFSAVLLNPSEALLAKIGRFTPWGGRPNQVGLLYSMAVPLLIYFSIRTPRMAIRITCLSLAAVGVGMAVIEASRAVMLTLVVGLLPLLVPMMVRRPVTMIIAGVIFAGAVGAMTGAVGEGANLERLTSLESERFHRVQRYVGYISERPLFGLMTSVDESYFGAVEDRSHTHNAYIKLLWMGGLSYFLPMFFLAIYSIWSGVFAWRHRRALANDPLLISTLFAMLLAVYIQGMADGSIYYATTLWAFWHVFLAATFITAWDELRMINAASAPPVQQHAPPAHHAAG